MLLQASDGLWAYVDDQHAVNAVSEVFEEACSAATGGGGLSGRQIKAAAAAAAERLASLARECGSPDEVSIIVNAYEWILFYVIGRTPVILNCLALILGERGHQVGN